MIKESNYCLFNEENHLNIKDLDKAHDQIIKNPLNETPVFFPESKKNFYNDSFYKNILSKIECKKNFQNVNQNIRFKTSNDSDINRSTLVDYYSNLKELEDNNEFKKMEENILNYNLSNYQKENYSLITKSYSCKEIKTDFKYYRRVKPNGNSFYISFIYQYIRDAISKGNETLIMNIINYKSNNYDINNIDIKDKNILICLFMIFRQINEKNFEEANNIFEFAILYKKEFAEYLCNYMRFKIKNFILSNKSRFTFEKYCESNKLINEDYFDIEKQFLDEKYINENVIIEQMEPSLFIISIVPYVFKVTMNLYIKELWNNIKQDDSLCEKIILNPDRNININILYSSFSYHIIELDIRNFEYDSEDLGNIFNFTNEDEIDSNIKEEYIKVSEGHCPDCNKTEFIILKNIENKPLCLNCLKNKIDEVLAQRYAYMKKEGFKYIEYYFQEIPLFKHDNKLLYLTFPEFYIIFKCNIFFYFRNLANSICETCFNFQRKGKYKKKCGCIKCINCAKKELKYFFFTDFEKNHVFKNKFIKCSCGANLNEVEFASQIYNLADRTEKEKMKEEANKRTKNYVRKYCMICGRKCEINKFYKYSFDNTKFSEHFICDKCYESINNNEPLSLFCIICHKEHGQNKNKIIDNTNKNNGNNKDENNINKDKDDENNNINKDENDNNNINQERNDINNQENKKKKVVIKTTNESNNIDNEESDINNNNKKNNTSSTNQKIQNKSDNNNVNNNKRASTKNQKIYQSTPNFPKNKTNLSKFGGEETETDENNEYKERPKTRRKNQESKCCIMF